MATTTDDELDTQAPAKDHRTPQFKNAEQVIDPAQSRNNENIVKQNLTQPTFQFLVKTLT